MARRATFVNKQRADLGRILLIDGGGFFHRAGTDWWRESVTAWRELERLGYDAVTLGELEANQWSLTDSLLQLGTTLPLVTTNIERRGGDDWQPVGSRCRVVEIDGVRVGFLSALIEGRAVASLAERTGGAVRVLPALETVREVARLLKGVAAGPTRAPRAIGKAEAMRLARESADILILIGYLDNPIMQTLADSIPEIDVILGGIHQPRDAGPLRMGHAIIQRAGDRGGAVAVTDLVVSPVNEIVEFGGRAALLDEGWPEDPQVAAVVAVATEATKRDVAAKQERMQQERMERFRQLQARQQRAGGGEPADSARSAPGDSLPPIPPQDPPR